MTKRKTRRVLEILVSGALLLSGCGLSGDNPKTDVDSSQTAHSTRVVTTQKGNLTIQESEYTGDYSEQTRALNVSNITRNVSSGAEQNANLPKIDSLEPSKEKGKTIMIYMVGSDLESNPDGRNATKDLTEMLNAEMDTSEMNLVVYTGGSNTWWNGLPNNQNCYLVYNGKTKNFDVLGSEDANMAAQDVLSSFLTTTKEKFPAQEYSMIFWNHGGGPLQGYGMDEKYEPDNGKVMNMLTINEIRQAFDEAGFGERKFDWIGFDACLMGSLEIASQMKDYTDTLIAAPETEPGCGWDYSFLKDLTVSMTPQEDAQIIIDGFANYLEENITARSNVRYSLVQYDLTKIDEVKTAVDTLFDKLNDDLKTNPQLRQKIVQAAGATWQYAYKMGLELFDLGQFASNLPEEYAKESDAVNEAIGAIIGCGNTNIANTTGLSFYMPVAGRETYELLGAKAVEENAISAALNEYIKGYVEEVWGVKTGPEELDRSTDFLIEETDNKKVYKIPEELQGKIASVSMTVFDRYKSPKEKDCSYDVLLMNVPVEMDETTITVDQNLPIAMYTGKSTGTITSEYVQSDNGKQYYCSVYTTLSTNNEYHTSKLIAAQIFFAWDPKNGTTSIDSIRIGKEDQLMLSAMKNDIDGQEYKTLTMPSVWGNSLNEEEKLKPYYQKDSVRLLIADAPFDESFGVEMVPATEYQKTNMSFRYGVSYQLIAKDLQGNDYVIAFEDLEMGNEPVVVKTDKGEMYFEVDEDQATLIRYEGMDRKLEVPAEVEGKPVKKINRLDAGLLVEVVLPDSVEELAPNAIYGGNLERITLSKNLKSIPKRAIEGNSEKLVIPEGVESIEDYAFSCSRVKELQIPASVKHIGAGAFQNCRNLEKITFENGSKYRMKDNFLFDETGEEIIAYFPALKAEKEASKSNEQENSSEKSETIPYVDPFSEDAPKIEAKIITIPKGTKRIAEGVFANLRTDEYNQEPTKFILPEGLEVIGPFAFFDAEMDMNCELPKSLKEIGTFAFGKDNIYTDEEENDSPCTIRFGPNLEKIEFGAFHLRNNVTLELDDKNPFFTMLDGKIMNLAGDTEIPIITSREDGVV